MERFVRHENIKRYRKLLLGITRSTIIPTRGARTASAKSNVNRPAPVTSSIF
jgi:hypothetical protein